MVNRKIEYDHSLFSISTTPRKELAIDCISSGLYVDGWSLCTALFYISIRPLKGRIAVCHYDEKPVAVMVILPWRQSNWIMCYVEPKFRRLGIGTLLFKRLNDVYKIDHLKLEHSKGKRGSIKFFSALGVNRNDS